MMASEKGHEEVLRMLLSAGAKVDLQDKVSSISFTQFPLLSILNTAPEKGTNVKLYFEVISSHCTTMS